MDNLYCIFIWIRGQKFYYDRNADCFTALPIAYVYDGEEILILNLFEATAKTIEYTEMLHPLVIDECRTPDIVMTEPPPYSIKQFVVFD